MGTNTTLLSKRYHWDAQDTEICKISCEVILKDNLEMHKMLKSCEVFLIDTLEMHKMLKSCEVFLKDIIEMHKMLKSCEVILKDIIEMHKMLKIAWKISFLAKVMIFWKLRFACNSVITYSVCQIFKLRSPKIAFMYQVPSCENHPIKSSETWLLIASLGGHLKKWRRDFKNFGSYGVMGQKLAQSGSHIGFLSF